jgi:hypothetical protein
VSRGAPVNGHKARMGGRAMRTTVAVCEATARAREGIQIDDVELFAVPRLSPAKKTHSVFHNYGRKVGLSP